MSIDGVTLDIFVVQPIQLEFDSFLKLLPLRVSSNIVNERCKPYAQLPEWLKNMRTSRDFVGATRELYFDTQGTAHLWQEDLTKSEVFEQDEDLALLVSRATKAPVVRLFYDSRFDHFLLTYRIQYGISHDELKRWFRVFSSRKEDDLYNHLRGLLVRKPSGYKGQWLDKIHELGCTTTIDFIEAVYGKKLQPDEVFVPVNTGNISFFYSNVDNSELGEITNLLHEVHRIAERVPQSNKAIRVCEGTSHLFGGRFHTIISTGNTAYTDLAGVQFHAQFMYIYLLYIGDLYESISDKIVLSDEVFTPIDLKPTFEDLILKIEQLTVHHEFVKMQLEDLSETVFEKGQKKWNLEGLLAQTSVFTRFLRDQLDILEKAEKRRGQTYISSLLTLVAVLQALVLVSAAVDLSDGLQGDNSIEILGLNVAPVVIALSMIVVSVSCIIGVVTVGRYFKDTAIKILRKRRFRGK